MSHARGRPTCRLVFDEEGGVELLLNGATAWAADADADFWAEFSEDLIEAAGDPDEDLVDDVLDYLVEVGKLDDDEADACYIAVPGDVTVQDEGANS